MKQLFFTQLWLTATLTGSFAQADVQDMETMLLQLDASKALLVLNETRSTRYDLYAHAWYLKGNKERRHFWAEKNDRQISSQASQTHLYFFAEEWEKAREGYRQMPEKSLLDHYRHAVAIFHSTAAPSDKTSAVEHILQQHQLGDQPAFQLILADAFVNERRFGEAEALLEPLQNSVFPYLRAEAIQKTARLQLLQNLLDEAFGTAQQALEINQEVHHERGQAYCLYLMATIRARQGRFEEGKQWARQGAFLARKTGDRSLEYSLNNILSWTYFSTQEPFDHILEHEKRQFQLANELGDDLKKAAVYNNLAYDHTVAGRITLDSCIALQAYSNAVYAREEGGPGRWYTLMNLVWQYRLKGDYDSSSIYAEQSLQQALTIEDRHAVIEAAFQYGETLLAQNKVEEAARYYDLGLEWRGEQVDRDAYVFDVYYAHYLWERGEKKQAVDKLESAVLFLAQSEVFYEMHGRALLAQYYWEIGEVEKAEQQLSILAAPRSDYMAFETRLIAAGVKAEILKRAGRSAEAAALLSNYKWQARMLGYH